MTKAQHVTLAGGCACGAVRFKADGIMRPIIGCHCETCRRTSGHYWAATATHQSNLNLMETAGLKWFDSSDFARRGFCMQCGSSLFYQINDSGQISIAAGSLDRPTDLRLVEHICTAEASDYYAIDSTLSQRPDCSISEPFQLPGSL